jgi:poly(3-hydroxybutyrate) depolymerase
MLLLGGCLFGSGDRKGSYGQSITGPGTGHFTFRSSLLPSEDPLKVWYAAPEEEIATAGVLVVMHGRGRDAEDYRDDWAPLARDRHILVIAPEFADEDYPGTTYNLGNTLDEDGDLQPEEEWLFPVIEALFDHVVADVGSEATDYILFGHSAGAQFVHRFLEFMPDARVSLAVAANAGWYTTMDDSVEFPYGLDEHPINEEDMEDALSTPLVVLLGGDDVDPEDDSLRQDEGSDEQGANRLERGMNFFLTSRQMAADQSMPFDWSLIVVPGVAHDHSDMARAAMPLVLDAVA